MIINQKTNRIAVIDPAGNLAEIKRDKVSDPKGDGTEGTLKSGWQYATRDDLAHAKAVEAKRAANEQADAEAALAAAKAKQDADDELEAESGGPFGAA